MKRDLSAHYVSELADLGLSPETIATLQCNGIATLLDLVGLMSRHELNDILTEDERYNLIIVSWRWMGRPLKFDLKPTE